MSSSSSLLYGKKVLIVGGSSGKLLTIVSAILGIGRGVAAASLSNGASVVISSSSEAKVNAAVELLGKTVENKDVKQTVTGQAFDMRDTPALTKFLSDNGRFDHLVFTAGDMASLNTNFLETEINETVKGQFDTRYWAPMIAAQFAHENKLINPGGSITMTMGTTFRRPSPGWALVSGLVGAIEGATRGLALDLKPIRQAKRFWDNTSQEIRSAMYEGCKERLLVGHAGTPDELAEAYIFSMKCSYFTGQVLTVDGGGVFV
ncbi:NAD(P)-binding protein [Ceratobasidium sp. AG-I]|nr:NAD(P)-binding protein [Ceratobasidium sp. AG-I]